MSDHELTINESSKVTIKIKTLFWILGVIFTILVSAFTLIYIDNKAKDKSQDKIINQVIKCQERRIDSIIQNRMHYMEGDINEVKAVIPEIGEIKTAVGIILDRTEHLRYPSVISNVRPNENVPE